MLEKTFEHQLYAKLKNYDITKARVAYLGHIVSVEGVAVDMEKVQAMIE